MEGEDEGWYHLDQIIVVEVPDAWGQSSIGISSGDDVYISRR